MTVTRTLLTAEYAMLRFPLTLLEDKVVTRYLDEESPVRLGFEKTLGSLDATVGRLVGNPDLTRRGSQLKHRAAMLDKAAVLEEKASDRRTSADTTLQQAKHAADRKRDAAEARARADVKDLRNKQEAEKQAARERAEAQVRAKAEQAARQAEAEVARVEARAAEQTAQVQQRARARTAKPKAQLREAVEVSTQAAKERTAAERLSDLAEQERDSRRSEPRRPAGAP